MSSEAKPYTTEEGKAENDALRAKLARLLEDVPRIKAAAREEQREACAHQLLDPAPPVPHSWTAVECIRATPLDATPLAERIAGLEKENRVKALQIDGLDRECRTQEAHRALAEARVKELEEAKVNWLAALAGASLAHEETLRVDILDSNARQRAEIRRLKADVKRKEVKP